MQNGTISWKNILVVASKDEYTFEILFRNPKFGISVT
jgi:hypothetical protein